MRTILTLSIAVACMTASPSGAVIPSFARAGDVAVTVSYTGKGPVDDTREIWVFLFPSPDIGPGARPLVSQTIKKSGTATVFTAVSQDPVYIAVAYDEKGNYDGNAGPPPPGTPISVYSTDGKGTPAPVKTAGGAKIKLSFNDARRMQ